MMKPRWRFSLLAGLLAIGLQSGCVPGGDGGGAGKPAANPITGDAITVTPLDPVASGPAVVAGKPAAAAGAARPRPRPEAAKPAADVAAGAEVPAEAEVPVEPAVPAKPKSPEEIRCGKKGGAWVGAGKTGAQLCVKPTRDGGQHCTKASDCEGLCLARSATCAPVQPLFGCNDILQDNGLQVTLCID